MTSKNQLNKFDNSRATKYENKIRRLLPGYEILHNFTHKLLTNLLPSKAEILIVGAGTGEDILICGKDNPNWNFTAIEPSSEMLEICRENVAQAKMEKRVTYFNGYLEYFSQNTNFDAATSILVSHFIGDLDAKFRYFSAINNHLKKDAVLITADMFGNIESEEFELIFDAWKAYFQENAINETEAEKSFTNIEKDISFISENSLKEMLKHSGFGEVYKFFQSLLFGGWITKKV